MTKSDILAKKYPRLNSVQMKILLSVEVNSGSSIADIARDCSLSPKTVQFHMKTMTEDGKKGRPNAAMGLVWCCENMDDRRKYEVFLTMKGKDAVSLIQSLGEKY